MKLLKDVQEIIAYRDSLPKDFSIGLVPTMGALHDGHKSLIEASKQKDKHTFVSIFVNPTQFGANEDFLHYPRNIEKDLEICEKIGTDVVFIPEISQMYSSSNEITIKAPKNMGYVYEGFIREGHFDGVLQIVMKLFGLVRPHHAYFGQKDAQQLLIIQKMIKDFFLPIELVPCPTKRDIDGLALSSRNVYLNAEQRQSALKISATLELIAQAIKGGEKRSLELLKIGKKALSGVKDLKVEYLDICDHQLVMSPIIKRDETIVLIAAKVGSTRLLDNLWV